MTSVRLDPATAVTRLLEERRSCRGFLDTPVPREILDRLLAMAQHSPSWCNTQPWELVITEGAATNRLRDALREHLATPGEPDLPFPDRYTGIYQERRRECGWQLYEAVGITRDDREGSRRQTMRNFEFFGAPHVAILTTTATLGVYGVLDCGVYLGNLLLAAESLGLAAIPQAALAMYAPLLREHFQLPLDRQVVCGISLGYADEDHPANQFRTRRAPIEQVVTYHDR